MSSIPVSAAALAARGARAPSPIAAAMMKLWRRVTFCISFPVGRAASADGRTKGDAWGSVANF
ncbi:hypothetical protein, partial [Methylosinus sp. 3S-1]|uniref:hypothetical protein n=1 Tax=Methylosinus sp. 3S-1 TaxID=1849840 RepID=UPI001FDA5B0B